MLTTALCLLFTQNAIAVPIQMNHQGRLLDSDSEGLSGSHELIFHIMDDLENGDEIWTETQTVQFINGYYSVLLGVDEELNPVRHPKCEHLSAQPSSTTLTPTPPTDQQRSAVNLTQILNPRKCVQMRANGASLCGVTQTDDTDKENL